jgi:hypothetical protein
MRCGGCGEEKPALDFVRTDKSKSSGYRLYRKCHTCRGRQMRKSAKERIAKEGHRYSSPEEYILGRGMPPTRRCKVCGEEKPALDFVRADKYESSGYRLYRKCHTCRGRKMRKSAKERIAKEGYRYSSPEEYILGRRLPPTMRCGGCGEEKPALDFVRTDKYEFSGYQCTRKCNTCRDRRTMRTKKERVQRMLASGCPLPTQKVCTGCHLEKPISEFRTHAYSFSGQSRCKDCMSKVDWMSNFRPFGGDAERLQYYLNATHCECCGKEFSKSTKINIDAKCQDHDHVLERLRGVICNNCNLLVGRVESGQNFTHPERYSHIYSYIEHWMAVNMPAGQHVPALQAPQP